VTNILCTREHTNTYMYVCIYIHIHKQCDAEAFEEE